MLTIVIPTRNRAALAKSALESVMGASQFVRHIILSDNSTDAGEADSLRQYCEELGINSVEYIRPPQSLSMSHHYNWATSQAILRQPSGYLTLLTDRMRFKRGALEDLEGLTRQHPGELISYNHDKVLDFNSPIMVEQCPWTGHAYRIRSKTLIRQFSIMRQHICIPRAMNCIVPVEVLESVKSRFGSYFESTAPDYNFGFKYLGMYDSFVYYDRSLLVHHRLDRSNGECQARGVLSSDHRDFCAHLNGQSYASATPAPDLLTLSNAITHEYCVARTLFGDDRFPEVDREAYFWSISWEIDQLENQDLKAELQARLACYGVHPGSWKRLPDWHPGRSASSPNILHRIGKRIYWVLRGNRLKPFWCAMHRAFRMPVPGENTFQFASSEEALSFIEQFGRYSQRKDDHISHCLK